MEFILTGFQQDNDMRRFSFEGIDADRKRALFTVSADLVASRKYQIALQELPLLCRRLLEQCSDRERKPKMTFTEENMRTYATERAAIRESAAQQKKTPRKPRGAALGGAWRAAAALSRQVKG